MILFVINILEMFIECFFSIDVLSNIVFITERFN